MSLIKELSLDSNEYKRHLLCACEIAMHMMLQ